MVKGKTGKKVRKVVPKEQISRNSNTLSELELENQAKGVRIRLEEYEKVLNDLEQEEKSLIEKKNLLEKNMNQTNEEFHETLKRLDGPTIVTRKLQLEEKYGKRLQKIKNKVLGYGRLIESDMDNFRLKTEQLQKDFIKMLEESETEALKIRNKLKNVVIINKAGNGILQSFPVVDYGSMSPQEVFDYPKNHN